MNMPVGEDEIWKFVEANLRRELDKTRSNVNIGSSSALDSQLVVSPENSNVFLTGGDGTRRDDVVADSQEVEKEEVTEVTRSSARSAPKPLPRDNDSRTYDVRIGRRTPKGRKRPTGKRRLPGKKRKRPNDVYVSLRPNEYCLPCRRTRDKARQFCTSDFVSKIHINRRKVLGNETRYDVTVLSSYRNRVRLKLREYIWVESTCRCPRLKSKRTYIVMGSMQNLSHRLARLVLTPKSFIRGFSVGFDRKIRQLSRTLKCNGGSKEV